MPATLAEWTRWLESVQAFGRLPVRAVDRDDLKQLRMSIYFLAAAHYADALTLHPGEQGLDTATATRIVCTEA